jgi:hypothetical protein
LNRSEAGPLVFLAQLLPDFSKGDRAWIAHEMRRLPDLIGLFGDLLRIYPPPKMRDPGLEAATNNCEVVLFYLLVGHFGFGYPTLSYLLRAMRQARTLAFPSAKYLRNLPTAGW